VSRLQQYTTTGFSHYGPPHSISHIHCIFSSFSHSLLLQVFFVLYIIQPPTAVTYYLVRHTSSLSTISRLTHHITSLFSYFPSCATYHLPFSAISRLAHHIISFFQLFPVLHITSSPFFSYFPSCTSPPFFSYYPSYTAHHLPFSAISRLTHHIISFFQLFSVLHITSSPFFSYFPSYTSHHLLSSAISRLTHHLPFSAISRLTYHLPFSAISRLTHHITSLFQLFPVLHITSPPFFSYFPSCTSHHLLSSAISRLTHHITSIFKLFPVLHITSPPFISYFLPYTACHLLFQSLPI